MEGPVWIYDNNPGQVNQYYAGTTPHEKTRGEIHTEESTRHGSK